MQLTLDDYLGQEAESARRNWRNCLSINSLTPGWLPPNLASTAWKTGTLPEATVCYSRRASPPTI